MGGWRLYEDRDPVTGLRREEDVALPEQDTVFLHDEVPAECVVSEEDSSVVAKPAIPRLVHEVRLHLGGLRLRIFVRTRRYINAKHHCCCVNRVADRRIEITAF